MITTLDATEAAQEPSQEQAPTGLPPEKQAALERLVQNREQLDPERRALVESLAQQHKIPMPPAKGFTEIKDKRREQMTDFGEAARVAALPMAGQLAGGVVGSALGPAGTIIGQSVGGIAGLLGNKALGVSNPDALDAALTGSAPFIARGVTTGGRRLIPGGEAAEQQIGAEMLRQTPGLLPGSKEATTQAYERVRALGNPDIPVPTFTKTVNDLFSTEQIARKYGAASPTILRGVKAARETLANTNGTMPFEDVAVALKKYRQKVAGLETKGGEEWGAYKELRKSLFDDMELAAKQGGLSADVVKAQREAMGAAKAQIAKEEFTEVLEKYGTKMVTVGGQTFEVIEPTKVLNKLRDMDFKASAGGQYEAIEKTLKQLAAIPKVDMHTRTGVGTSGRAVAMAGATIAGGALGTPVVGGASGALAAYAAIQIHDAVASLFMSDRGRQFLVKLFKANRGRMSERTGQLLQFAASQFQDTGD